MEDYNIVYICDYAAKYTGNFIASLSALSAEAEKKNTVYFLFPEAARNMSWVDTLSFPSDRIFFCDFNTKSLFLECRKLSRKLQPNNTIVHTHFVGDLFLLAIRMCFHNVVCHFHMTAPENTTLSKKIKRAIRKIIYHNTVIVGVSEAVTNDLSVFFNHHVCECIPNAIDFGNMDRLGLHFPESVTLDSRKFNLLIHGTHFLRKGVDLAIQAIESLNTNGFNYKLYVTSNDSDEANRFAKEYYTHSDYVDVIDVVENIKALYDQIDVFLSPSRLEAFGYAVVEAAYSDCQVIASDIPGQDSMKNVPGILWIEKENVESLKAAILTAKENKEKGLVNQINQMQKDYVTKEYDISKWVSQNLALYQKHFG